MEQAAKGPGEARAPPVRRPPGEGEHAGPARSTRPSTAPGPRRGPCARRSPSCGGRRSGRPRRRRPRRRGALRPPPPRRASVPTAGPPSRRAGAPPPACAGRRGGGEDPGPGLRPDGVGERRRLPSPHDQHHGGGRSPKVGDVHLPRRLDRRCPGCCSAPRTSRATPTTRSQGRRRGGAGDRARPRPGQERRARSSLTTATSAPFATSDSWKPRPAGSRSPGRRSSRGPRLDDGRRTLGCGRGQSLDLERGRRPAASELVAQWEATW